MRIQCGPAWYRVLPPPPPLPVLRSRRAALGQCIQAKKGRENRGWFWRTAMSSPVLQKQFSGAMRRGMYAVSFLTVMHTSHAPQFTFHVPCTVMEHTSKLVLRAAVVAQH